MFGLRATSTWVARPRTLWLPTSTNQVGRAIHMMRFTGVRSVKSARQGCRQGQSFFGIRRALLSTVVQSKSPMSFGVKFALFSGIGAGGIGLVSWQLGMSATDWKYFMMDVLGQAEPPKELVNPEEVIDLPELPAPEDYVHPYTSEPVWWQWLFTVRRCIWLLVNLTPVLIQTLRLSISPSDPEMLDTWCEALVTYINKAGCSFQKFGQWVSMRPDMFPAAMIKACSRLRDEVPCHSYEETVSVIESSTGKSMDELFVSIDNEPVASGSVAQVYKAELKPEYALHDGSTTVAIKVRHPSVLNETFVDLKIIYGTVPILNFIFSWTTSKPVGDGDKEYSAEIAVPFSTDSLFNTIQKQLDFKYEAFNIMEFHRNFYREILDENVNINFPIVSTKLLSESMLVESWIPGDTIASMFSSLKNANEEARAQLAKLIFDITAKMFLRDNFIHGDLHAGNLLYNPDSSLVSVMDAGLVTTLPDDVFNEFGDFIRALCTKDTTEMRDKLILFHDESAKNAIPRSTIDAKKLGDDLDDIFINGAGVQRPGVPLAQALGDIIGDMLRRIGYHGVLLRGDVASCIMTISVAEGLVMSLDPTLDVLQTALPYFVRYRGWASADAILDNGYETSERKAKDVVAEMAKPIKSAENLARKTAQQAEEQLQLAEEMAKKQVAEVDSFAKEAVKEAESRAKGVHTTLRDAQDTLRTATTALVAPKVNEVKDSSDESGVEQKGISK